jgi:hypothetical protein
MCWHSKPRLRLRGVRLKKALNCLESALRIRHVALESLKVSPFLDPLRKVQAIEQELKFPD